MRIVMLLAALGMAVNSFAQATKIAALPEFVFIPQAPEQYVWERVTIERGRTLFNNAVACDDSTTYSFGGFNSLRVQREMNGLSGKTLTQDTLAYPGAGFMSNLFFIRYSLIFIGGGHDSRLSRYTYADFWQFNRHSHAWKRLNDLPFYYHHSLSVFTDNDRVIVLVAELQMPQLTTASPAFYEYDFATDNWRRISERLLISASSRQENISYGLYPAAFSLGTDIYVFLQMWETGANSFYRFSTQSGKWFPLPSFPGSTEWLFGAFALSDGVYGYVGGGAGKRAGNSKEVFRYDPEKGSWQRITNLPSGVRYAKGWRFNGESYVGFGINDKDLTVMNWKLKMRKR